MGESETADHAIHAIDAKDVDLVVMDLQMPGMTGIEATRVLQEKHEELPVLILTAFDQEYFEVAMEAGVTGYVSKSCTPAQLIQAIQAAYLGHALIDPALAGRLVRELGQLRKARQSTLLTPRQLDILQMVSGGSRYREIAETLFLHERTVNREMRNIFERLGVHDAAHAVSEAYKNNLL